MYALQVAPIEVVVNVPQQLTRDEETGWYIENPTELRVTVKNNTAEVFSGEVEVTFSSSQLTRLVFYDNGVTRESPPFLRRPILLGPGGSTDLTWPMWAQPMSQQSINFTAKVVDGANQLIGQDNANIVVDTARIYPVVVIPGAPGSWMNFWGEWKIDPLTHRYDNLLEELRLAGYEDNITLFTFPYDWRQHAYQSGLQLGGKITDFLSSAAISGKDYINASKVDIVAHSFGGIVSRAYIQGGSYGLNVHRLITLGTPHRGFPSAYLKAEGLDFQDDNGLFALPKAYMFKTILRDLARKYGYCTRIGDGDICVTTTDAQLYRYILYEVPSVRQAFPTETYHQGSPGYLVDANDPQRAFPYGHYVNDFLNSLNEAEHVNTLVDRLGPENVIAVVGEGAATDVYYRVSDPGPEYDPLLNPLWSNGKVESREKGSGDNTVPKDSADLSQVNGQVQREGKAVADNGDPIKHGNLPTQLQQSIVELLTGKRPFFDSGFADPTEWEALPGLVFSNLSPVEIQVIDPLGRRTGVDFSTSNQLAEIPNAFFSRSNLPNEPDFLFIPGALPGEYHIRLQGIAQGQYTVGVEVFTEGGPLTVAEFSGTTSPGTLHEHSALFKPDALPTTPISLQWHPPLHEAGGPPNVSRNATLPIKFTIRDAQGGFVVDNSILIWIVDPTDASSTVAAFSGLHEQSGIFVDQQNEQYIVGLVLSDYNFEPSKLYIVGANVFGQQLGTRAFTVNPAVGAPTVAPEPSGEGSAATASATFSAYGIKDAAFTCMVSYGDGSGNLEGTISGNICNGSAYTYTDDGSYQVTVSVTDQYGGTGTSTATHVVNNVAPTVGEITAPIDPVQVNTGIIASADFTDPGMLDTHTAIWDWGDVTTLDGTVDETNGSGSASGSHAYGAPDVYTIVLTITDKDGGSASSEFRYVVIYDPEGGFVTGGGWIDSPEGAYTADPTLTGKANFGFVSKYKKGATVPTGQTQFQFKVADLNFHSDSYEWLVIAGAKAKYKGVGTINGEGEYKFMLTAIDADVNKNNSHDVDRFRIKIWGDSGVIYDNQQGASDDSNDATELGGGNIVIHQ